MSSPSKETTTEKPVEVAKETKETVAATGEEKPKESVFAMKPGPFSFSTTATTSAKPAFSFAAPKLDAKEDDEAPQEEESDVPDVDTSGAHKTMEEDEDVLFTAFSKLYRWDDKIKEWRESGTGEAKILKNKESGKIRFLMRREKVFKICGNHYVVPGLDLKENSANDKSWVWNCPADYADPAAPTSNVFAIRFRTLESTAEFKKVWESSQEEMKKFLEKK